MTLFPVTKSGRIDFLYFDLYSAGRVFSSGTPPRFYLVHSMCGLLIPTNQNTYVCVLSLWNVLHVLGTFHYHSDPVLRHCNRAN